VDDEAEHVPQMRNTQNTVPAKKTRQLKKNGPFLKACHGHGQAFRLIS